LKNKTALSISTVVSIPQIQALNVRILYKCEPFAVFLSVLLVEKIKAKVNAFMLPDGEADQNFQKGEL
jgi:hypothetical protein